MYNCSAIMTREKSNSPKSKHYTIEVPETLNI